MIVSPDALSLAVKTPDTESISPTSELPEDQFTGVTAPLAVNVIVLPLLTDEFEGVIRIDEDEETLVEKLLAVSSKAAS
tara:strand:+ start:1032 stop:1268 length:237 start_codon:yes stop_codon:yes gene_type:complete